MGLRMLEYWQYIGSAGELDYVRISNFVGNELACGLSCLSLRGMRAPTKPRGYYSVYEIYVE